MKMKGRIKRILTGLMVLLMMITLLPEGFNIGMIRAYGETDQTGVWSYNILEDGNVEILEYMGNAAEVVVPNEIDGNSVISIGNAAFMGDSSTKIVISSGITSINESAFAMCSKLTSIEIPESVTSIGYNAFYGCSELTSIEIPSGVKNIEGDIFSGCDSLISIDVAEDNEVYDSRENCNAIIETKTNQLKVGCKTTKIPSGVTSIGDDAFIGCGGLTSIEIPNSVTSIGNGAFAKCSGLIDIEIPSGVTHIGNRAFSGCSSLESIEIPTGVTKIKDSVFENCSSLKSIEIPTGVTSIGNYAFAGCNSIENIKIPENVTSIGNNAFASCSCLESIEIPTGVTSIGNRTFASCSGLEKIEIPTGVTSIGMYAFARCSCLKKIEVPRSVTDIGVGSFEECDNLVIYSYADAYVHTYTNSHEIEWKEIKDILPENSSITIGSTTCTYDGEAKCPSVVVKYGNTTLVSETDYTVEYTNNVKVGIATVVVTGKDAYKGLLKATFTIIPATITDVTLETTTYTYDGKAKCPTVTVKSGTKVLTNGTDYTVEYTNNVKVGTATVTVTGKGNCKGTITKTFTIKEEKLAAVQSLKQSTAYATDSITLNWNKVKNASGYEIYRATSKNGKYKKIVTTSKTSYKDKNLKAGTTYYYKVRAYKNNYGVFSEIKAMKTKCVAPSIKLTAGKKQVEIICGKITGAEGYEFYMATSKSGKYKKIKTLTSKKLSFTQKKLTKGRKYYFKAKAYSKINGKKVYSGWSKVGNVKVK